MPPHQKEQGSRRSTLGGTVVRLECHCKNFFAALYLDADKRLYLCHDGHKARRLS